MANKANTPRKASAKLLVNQFESLKLICGMVTKVTRAYISSGKAGTPTTQRAVGATAGLSQSYISQFENGAVVPANDVDLQTILTESGFDIRKPGALAFFELLKFIRDKESDIQKLEEELPE
jgi:hypothetical protein